MTMPTFTMRQLLEAGVHFGHHTRRWNPKMKPYLFGVRNGVHIIDLTKTVPLLEQALKQVRDVVASGGRVLFVGTKPAAAERVAEAAKRCGQYYVNHRWLGGMITNWNTISASIKRLRELDERLKGDVVGLTKKEQLDLTREREKLERSLGGIKEMGGTPDMLFIIDTNKESIAVLEARKLRHSDRRGGRQQLRSGRHRLPDPGQRRRDPRHLALLRPARRARCSTASVPRSPPPAVTSANWPSSRPRKSRRSRPRLPRPPRPSNSAPHRREIDGAGRKTGPCCTKRSKTWLRSLHRSSRNCARRPARA